MKTYVPKKDEVESKWVVIDAADQVLGKVAVKAASILRGKTKPEYTPFIDVGDSVIIVNAEKVKITGNKLDGKLYQRHTGHPGGLKETTLRVMLDTKPGEVVRKAVKGMLPHNRLGRAMLKKLRVYRGAEHPHEAQQPEAIEV